MYGVADVGGRHLVVEVETDISIAQCGIRKDALMIAEALNFKAQWQESSASLHPESSKGPATEP